MRKIAFMLTVAFVFPFLCLAQTDPLRTDLNTLFGALDASQVPSGYLAPYDMEMADKDDFNGAVSDSNVVNDMDIVRMLYADIYTSRFYTSARTISLLDTLNSVIKRSADNSLVLFYGQYSNIREDAVQQNLLSYSGGRLYDVAGRTQSPYILKNTFVAFPKNKYFTNGTVTLKFSGSQYFSNTAATISSLQADFGAGYITIPLNGTATGSYSDSTGWHLITMKATLSNGTTQYSKMAVWVKVSPVTLLSYTPADLTTPDITIAPLNGTHSGCRVYIRRSVNTPAGQIRKPLIVAEGLDIHDAAPDLAENYTVNNLITEWQQVTFATNFQTFDHMLDDVSGYDLVFIDWGNGTDAITRNAAVLEDVINRINTLKAQSGSSQQDVVMGISIGGLVTRYCLASMTKRALNPQTRLLITQDSPHQGAYVPLAFQHLVLGLQNQTVLGIRFGAVHSDVLDQTVTLLQSQGA